MSVRLLDALRYRGGGGMWSWLLHRVSGVGIVAFLLLHIVDIFLMGFGPKTFNALLFLYHSWFMRPLLVGLVFGVLFHALNGLRIIIVDFWPAATRYNRQLLWAQTVVFLAVFLPAAYATLVSGEGARATARVIGGILG